MSAEGLTLEAENFGSTLLDSQSGQAGELIPSPRSVVRADLKTADDVRLEMAKVYRDSKTGKLEARKGCQLIYMLSEIRRSIETDVLERRMEVLERESKALLAGPTTTEGVE